MQVNCCAGRPRWQLDQNLPPKFMRFMVTIYWVRNIERRNSLYTHSNCCRFSLYREIEEAIRGFCRACPWFRVHIKGNKNANNQWLERLCSLTSPMKHYPSKFMPCSTPIKYRDSEIIIWIVTRKQKEREGGIESREEGGLDCKSWSVEPVTICYLGGC